MIPLADRRTFAELLALARAQGWRIEMLSKQAVRVTHERHRPASWSRPPGPMSPAGWSWRGQSAPSAACRYDPGR